MLGMEGAIIEEVEETEQEIHISIEQKRTIHHCPRCASETDIVHDYRATILKDTPIRGKTVRIHYRKRRYVCTVCGKRFLEQNDLVARYHRITKRLTVLVFVVFFFDLTTGCAHFQGIVRAFRVVEMNVLVNRIMQFFEVCVYVLIGFILPKPVI